MGQGYEPIGKARFTVERGADGDLIRVKAERQTFILLFLPVWLALWTAGGVAAVFQMSRHFEPFLVIWLCFWAAGWLTAASTLVWMFTGSETLTVVRSDLEVARHWFRWTKRRVYRGGEIRRLSAADQPALLARFQWVTPFQTTNRWGALKFDYGPRTIYLAPGLDPAEGRMIAERLLGKLPPSAR